VITIGRYHQSGGPPDSNLGLQTCGLGEPEDAVDGDLLKAACEDAGHGAARETCAVGQLGMSESPAIDLTKHGRDQLRLEDGLEAAALRELVLTISP